MIERCQEFVEETVGEHEDETMKRILEEAKKTEDDGVVLKAFMCPLTKMTIREPAATIYGNLFEEAAIKEWVRMQGSCPLTKRPL